MHWTRGNGGQLSKYFHAKELTCKCGLCKQQFINDQLLELLDKLREDYGHPIRVTSAFRCARHQEVLRRNGLHTAVGQSTHETGNAVDVAGVGQWSMTKLRESAERVFKDYSIGYANNFLHLDNRPGGRRWQYK